MLSHLGSSINARIPQCDKCWATNGSTKTKENGHILDVTNDNRQKEAFMKAQHSQVSILYIDEPACQMPSARDYNKSISASIRM